MCLFINVALFVSAWIETKIAQSFGMIVLCRTLRECVDWNNIQILWFVRFWVALFVSAWIETSIAERIFIASGSHSSWVRGLKLHNNCNTYSNTEVALFVSAWIETVIREIVIYHIKRRTLRECVDWNPSERKCIIVELSHSSWVRGLKPTFIDSSLQIKSRTLRECVDWNSVQRFNRSIWHVALFVSAWIETYRKCLVHQEWIRSHSSWVRGLKLADYYRGGRIWCRTLRECVDWNLIQFFDWQNQLSRTLRECVDWNCWL